MVLRNLILCFAIGLSLSSILVHPLRAQERNHPDLFSLHPSPRQFHKPTDGDYVSYKNLPMDLGRNFRGLFTNNNLATIAFGAGITGFASMFDEREFDGVEGVIHPIHEPREGSSLGRLGERMGHHYVVPGVIAGLAVMGQIAHNRRFEEFSYSLVQGYIVNNLVTTGLKEAVGRTRPNQRNNLSFPSGHTSNAFTWATILSHYYGTKAVIPAYGIAAFVAWSRLNVDAHYLSDVMFGAALGYVVGRTVVRTTDERASEARLQWHLTAGTKEAGFSASYRW
jgi:hypothetical protein